MKNKYEYQILITIKLLNCIYHLISNYDLLIFNLFKSNGIVDKEKWQSHWDQNSPTEFPVNAQINVQHEFDIFEDSLHAIDPNDAQDFEHCQCKNHESASIKIHQIQNELSALLHTRAENFNCDHVKILLFEIKLTGVK